MDIRYRDTQTDSVRKRSAPWGRWPACVRGSGSAPRSPGDGEAVALTGCGQIVERGG